MHASTLDGLKLTLGSGHTLELSYPEAYALLLFTTRLGWTKDKRVLHTLRLLKPISICVSERETLKVSISNLLVEGYFNEQTVRFIPLDSEGVRVKINELRIVLEHHFIKMFGPHFALPNKEDIDAVVEADDYKVDGDYEIPTPITYNGATVFLGHFRSSVNLFTRPHSERRPYTDTELLVGNKNLPRPEDVTVLTMKTSEYFGGYGGKERAAHVRFRFGSEESALAFDA